MLKRIMERFVPQKLFWLKLKIHFLSLFLENIFGCITKQNIFVPQSQGVVLFYLFATRLLTSDILFLHFHIVDLFMGYRGRASCGIRTDVRKL